MKAAGWYRSAKILYFYKNISRQNNETEQIDQLCYQLLHNVIKTIHMNIKHTGINHVQTDQCSCLKCFDPNSWSPELNNKTNYRYQWIDISYLFVKTDTCWLGNKTVTSWLFGAVKTIAPRCLGRPDALLPELSEAPRGYRFDYSPNIHEITIY